MKIFLANENIFGQILQLFGNHRTPLCWADKEFLSPVKITLFCSLVLDLRAVDV